MKKLILFLFCAIIFVPTIVSAHTSLSSSNPSEGQVITENLEQLTLQFATTIEELSTMELAKDGNKVALEDVKVENTQLIGRISEPLANGSYTIQWKIIGEDGHPIKGEINFEVQMANQPDSNTTSPEANQDNQKDEGQTNQVVQDNNNNAPEKTDVQTDSSSSTPLLAIFIGLLIVFGIVLLMFTKKKK